MLTTDLAVPLTIVWVVVVVNAVNLLDGLDGLAAGMIGDRRHGVLRLHGALAGACSAPPPPRHCCRSSRPGWRLGFLPWNFYPAKIFMGDTGAMLLGLLLAIARSRASGATPIHAERAATSPLSPGPVVVPLLILFIPFLDVVLAVVRRTRRGEGIGHADKEHLHHRLLDVGHTQRSAVLLMYLWSALISGCALAVGLINGRLAVGSIVAAAVLLHPGHRAAPADQGGHAAERARSRPRIRGDGSLDQESR